MHKHCTSIVIAGAYATLPGASATVNINFSNISTRLRNQLIHSLETYPKVVKGWGKTKKLMRFLQEYYKFGNSKVDDDWIHLYASYFQNHKEVYEKLYEFCKASILANRMDGGTVESYEYSMRRLESGYEGGRLDYYTSRHKEKPFASGVGLELAQQASKILREQEAEKLSEALDIVKNGKTLTMYIN